MHFGQIGVDAAGHPPQAKKVHCEKSQIKSDEEEPEMHLGEGLVRHAPYDFRKPVINATEHGEHCATDEHVVEVRDHEEGVVHLEVERNGSQHQPRKAANHKNKEEAADPKHGQAQLWLPIPQRCYPAKKLVGSGNHNHQRRRGEEAFAQLWDTRRKHVMNPDAKAEKSCRNRGHHDAGVAKYVAPGKRGYQSGNDGCTR